MNNQCLMIFTRYPEPGISKTRLIPALGAEKAAEISKKLSEHTFKEIRNLSPGIIKQVHYQGGDRSLMEEWLGLNFSYIPQTQGDLGEKMLSAFQAAFALQFSFVIIIGTDCPGLTSELISEAFTLLTIHDLVIGPALDGGYYLLGMNKFCPQLFHHLNWGSDQVLIKTLEIAQQTQLNVKLLPERADVDRPDDLYICHRYNII